MDDANRAEQQQAEQCMADVQGQVPDHSGMEPYNRNQIENDVQPL